MKVLICVVMVFFISIFSVNSQNRPQKQEPQPISLVETVNLSISADAAERIINLTDHSDLVILDVRLSNEYNLSKIDNAVNVFYNPENFNEKISDLDKTKQYLIYCRSGARSAQAAEDMHNAGFKRLLHLKGGLLAWEALSK